MRATPSVLLATGLVTTPLKLVFAQAAQEAVGFWQKVGLWAPIVASVAIALFTFLVWRVHRSEHALTHFARLQVGTKKAVFVSTSKVVRLEVLLINLSEVPAVIVDWQVVVKDTNSFSKPIGDGELVKTSLGIAPSHIRAKGWVLERRLPASLSIKQALDQQLTGQATIDVEISYAGGEDDLSVLKDSVKVELA